MLSLAGFKAGKVPKGLQVLYHQNPCVKNPECLAIEGNQHVTLVVNHGLRAGFSKLQVFSGREGQSGSGPNLDFQLFPALNGANSALNVRDSFVGTQKAIRC